MFKPVIIKPVLAYAAVAAALAGSTSLAGHAETAGQPKASTVEASAPATPSPEMKTVLDKLAALGAKPIETLTPEEARSQPSPADAVKAVMKDKGVNPKDTVVTRDLTYPGAAGELPARVFIPARDANAGSREKLPLIVYYHGGGWVIADIETYAASAKALAEKTPAVVVSVEYRKAPESPLPAAHKDAFAAYQWALENAASWGADPERVAVAGESAGGNLAANVAIMAREENIEEPDYMALVYPVAGLDMTTPSYRRNAHAKPLSKDGMQWFAEKAIKGEEAKEVVNLLDADLEGLPPATIVTAEIDPLRSEGQMLARELEEAGVKVKLHDFKNVTHEFFGMAPVVPAAAEAQKKVAGDLHAALAGGARATAAAEEGDERPAEGGDQ